MPASDKDTIYIDIDDEITGIIDKLRNSKGKVVALVLPKRASVFQSVVNMKLLKRAADAEKKNAVLITAEAGLLPLAGVAGLHVAKTLNSKPEIPLAPQAVSDAVDAIGEDGEAVEDMPPDPKQAVGDLAAKAGTKPPADGVETLMLDSDALPPEADAAADGKPGPKTFEPPKDGKKNKNKKLKVPNFERFRLLLILGVVLIILLIIGFIFANSALPKATINIKTDATNVDANLNLNLSTTATNLQSGSNTLPAKLVQQQKVSSASEVTTGQKNNGTKAQGSIDVSAGSCSGPLPASIPSGTGFSSNGLTYLTQDTITFLYNPSNGGKQCTEQGFNSNGSPSIPIIAQAGGSSSNTSGSPFTDPQDASLTASGSASGGTDDIVQTVNQNDIDNAKAKISTNDASVEQSLVNQLQQDGYFAIKVTYSPGTPNVTTSANVGDVANSVTVTETINYTMFGVHRSDLASVVDNNIDGQIDTSKQSILNDGIDSATFSVNTASATGAQLSMSTVAVAGPQLNITTIKQQAEGQKSGQIESQLETDPDVKGVTVKLSPFWVTTVPKNTSRITVNVAKPTTTAKASSNANNP
jgi:hypothetical protein